jgi:hypothetical protein
MKLGNEDGGHYFLVYYMKKCVEGRKTFGKTIRKDPCLLDIQEYHSNFQPCKVLANFVKFLTINQSIGKFHW